MKQRGRFLGLISSVLLFSASPLQAEPYLMENLGRGMVVVRSSATEAYIGWRLLATDPSDIAFNVYRSTGGAGAVLLNGAPLSATTNYVDAAADLGQSNEYSLRPVIGGAEQAEAGSFTLPAGAAVNQYLSIPLQVPPGGVTPVGGSYTYSANDASVGDLDGDGAYEIVLKWDPSNSQDNANDGYTGNVYIDAYELDGTRLWRIDLGRNIRAGAHYTQLMVYDLDGDGKAEIACKTADATVDGQGTVIGNPDADYRNSAGRILDGPEFLTIFDGETGAALATTSYVPARGVVADWGDAYGNRVDRFLAAIAYLDGHRPSLVMCRGYYTRAVLAAWNWRGGVLSNVWTFDSDDGTPGNAAYRGQGNHNLSVGDVDGDGKQEIVYGAAAIDHDGTGLYSTGWGHGDALHLSDMDPDRPGLEVFQPHEVPSVAGAEFRDARTGQLIWGVSTSGDNGRGLAADIDPARPGFEMWTGQGVGLRDKTGAQIGAATPPINFAVWWDADSTREMLDQVTISKWDPSTNTSLPLLEPTGVSSNNGTKANPVLSADILGDWREEVILRTTDSTALRIYTTTIPATTRLYTLMHDPQYRVSIAWQNVAYNQPPHTSFYLGEGMIPPPVPDIVTVLDPTPGPSTPVITAFADDTGVSATDRVTSDQTLSLSGSADPGNTVSLTKVGTGIIGTALADGGTGNWSFDYSAASLAEGSHFFSATATDGIETSGSLPPVQVVVDTTAPAVLSSNRLNPVNELTSANTVIYRVGFDERIAGVTTASFALTATGSVTGTISAVSATEGNLVDVTVSMISGLGTLRLDVPAAGSGLTDLAGNGLSGGFVAGELYSFVSPTWIEATSGGLWSDAANWASGIIGDGLGLLANFNSVDLVADNTVILDSPRTLGSLVFGDADVSTPGSWLVDDGGAGNTLTLAVGSGSPTITVNAMGTGATTTFAAPLAGTAGLTKAGTGTLTLAGVNSLSGTTAVGAGTLRIAGVHAPTAVTVASAGARLSVAGGALTVSGPVTITAGGGSGVYVESGTAAFDTISTNNSRDGVVRFAGGTVTANDISFPRSADGSWNYNSGFIMTGGSATVGTIRIATNNSNGAMSVEGGVLLTTGPVTIGSLTAASSRGGHMRVTGGTFTVADVAHGLIVTRGPNNVSDVSFLGGVSTLEKVTLGYDSATIGGSATLNLNGGTVYLGSGGIVKNGTGAFVASLNLTGGSVESTLGAKASWSSSLPMVLLGTPATLKLKAADAADSPFDITMEGALSGAGGFSKTGAGTLTLGAVNTFTGSVSVESGTLALSGSIAAGSDGTVSLDVGGGGSLTGNGAIARPVVLASGGRVIPGNGTLGSVLTVSEAVTWNGGGRLVSSFQTGGVLSLGGALGKSGTGQIVEASTSVPLSVGTTITLATFASTDLLASDLVLLGLGGHYGRFIINPTSLQLTIVEPHQLDVTLAGTGTGSVSSLPAGIDCGTDCTETYGAGTVVTLTATADAGSRFEAWSGACSGTSPTCEVTVDAAKSVTATFARKGYFTSSPCRVFDSRSTGALAAQSETVVALHGVCGVPALARSASINVTVTGPTAAGYLTLFADGASRPAVSALNYTAAQTRANNAMIPIGSAGGLRVFLGQASGTAHVIIDVNGYFD